MFKITRDFTGEEYAYSAVNIEVYKMPLYGIERAAGVDDALPANGNVISFRLYDDDDNLVLSGNLDDDEECTNQTAALRYGESYAGATRIDVQRDGEWCTEIG